MALALCCCFAPGACRQRVFVAGVGGGAGWRAVRALVEAGALAPRHSPGEGEPPKVGEPPEGVPRLCRALNVKDFKILVKSARARYGFWRPRPARLSGMLLQVK